MELNVLIHQLLLLEVLSILFVLEEDPQTNLVQVLFGGIEEVLVDLVVLLHVLYQIKLPLPDQEQVRVGISFLNQHLVLEDFLCLETNNDFVKHVPAPGLEVRRLAQKGNAVLPRSLIDLRQNLQIIILVHDGKIAIDLAFDGGSAGLRRDQSQLSKRVPLRNDLHLSLELLIQIMNDLLLLYFYGVGAVLAGLVGVVRSLTAPIR
eukprot:CAMPEP_0170561292 /NCGR_PEP_ID=MMETSP0211-20121228/53907_1 /TAXON_ID=311385 /ORGANISM="Pseudokeronopsis sp., Strain OXSARD2" /LENGTH=205 /DNA_ID=CAMNT_0010876639 /DNA_START=1142 /DNA_END=1756 /DNA_ORIENTATION=+